MVGWSDFSFKYCAIIGVIFSVGLFLTAASLISLGTLVIGSFWRCAVSGGGGASGLVAGRGVRPPFYRFRRAHYESTEDGTGRGRGIALMWRSGGRNNGAAAKLLGLLEQCMPALLVGERCCAHQLVLVEARRWPTIFQTGRPPLPGRLARQGRH